jgi:hypothetical protein
MIAASEAPSQQRWATMLLPIEADEPIDTSTCGKTWNIFRRAVAARPSVLARGRIPNLFRG